MHPVRPSFFAATLRTSLLAVLELAVTSLAVGCQSARADPEAAASAGPGVQRRTDKKANESDAARAALEEKLRPWLNRHDPPPRRRKEQRCPDEVIRSQATSDDARTIALLASDARLEKKNLIPLEVMHPLTTEDAPSLEAALLRGAANDEIKARIDWLARRRWVGVFHVTDYEAPRWIWRLDRAKAAWVPGWIAAWLVVHDAQTGEALCSAEVHVKNDVTGAPLGTRARADTAERLTAELGRDLAALGAKSLARISTVLRAPTTAEPRTGLDPRPKAANLPAIHPNSGAIGFDVGTEG